MSFIDDSIKNIEKSVLKEASGVGGVGGFTGKAGVQIDQLFAGGYHPDSGHGSKNLELLKKQLEDRIQKIKDTNSVEMNPVGGWYKTNTEMAIATYKELIDRANASIKYSIENTPIQDTEWKSTGVNIDFDDIYTHIDNEEDFINRSQTNMKHIGEDEDYVDETDTSLKTIYKNDIGVSVSFDEEEDEEYDEENNYINTSDRNMQSIDTDIKYDDNPNYYASKNFINTSKTNWKLVGRK